MMGEQRAEQQFSTLLGCAAEDWMCKMPALAAHWPASWELWTTAMALLTGPLLVIEIKFYERGLMCFLQ